jgi:hypothetical protein
VSARGLRSQLRLLSTPCAGVISQTGHLNEGVARLSVARYSTRGHRVAHRESTKDLYAILGVSPHATQQQVKDSYYKLSLQYHPDRNRGSQEAHRKFTDLTEAYSVLGQYELRKKYDKGLLQHFGRHDTTRSVTDERDAHLGLLKGF